MTPQETLIQYALSRMGKVGFQPMTPQNWIGKAFAEGIVIERTPNSVTSCKISKPDGKTIVVTETTTSTVPELHDGKLSMVETSNTVEIMRISL
jgi:hypothetical protein